MAMLHSVEVRWFVEGAAPASVLAFFENTPLAKAQSARIDEYLLLPDCETVGVKVREGQLQVKAQTSKPERLRVSEAMEGRRDGWVKWPRPVEQADEASFRRIIGAPEDRWAFVRKERVLRTYAFENGEAAEVDTGRTDLQTGCALELTWIRAFPAPHEQRPACVDDARFSEAARWWSIGFEAFGARAEESLRVAMRAFDADAPADLRLGEQESLSYPAWLARRFQPLR